jgi:transketolase
MHVLMTDRNRADVWAARRTHLRGLTGAERAVELRGIATGIRRTVLGMISGAGQGHIGGDFSVIDSLTVLYNSVLDLDPADPRRAGRDIFILSKGHAAASLYATLADAGFIAPEALDDYLHPASMLNGHPARAKVAGVETSTGPLGHGLPVAVGAALGQRLAGAGGRVVVITGDGELQEGSNWEAFMSAAHFGLDNLTFLVDRNRLQQGARTEETNALDPLDSKLAAFGWEVREIDGHDFTALEAAFGPSTTGKPVAIIANTVKGKGVSFIEDRAEWHHKVPSAEQVLLAEAELV